MSDIAIQRNIDILANKTFSLHRCTPLYKFQRNSLTKYGEELYAFMVAQMTDSTTVITEEEADMFNGRVISVQITTINPSEWTGLAGSPLIVEIMYKPRAMFTRFPMLLIKAPPKLAEIIFEWLQTRFDCRICRYRLQSAQLRFIAEEWAKSAFGQEQLEANNVKSLELSYSLPNIDELKTMTVNIPFEDVKRIYNGCTTSSETDGRLMQAIEHHIFHISRIKLSSLVLSRIGTNTIYLAGEGKAKFFLLKDTNTTVKVLEQLIAIAK
ncbi:7450_t:CDS:2 [Paraglomus occultum]|uniref:7450_t:CDS:1 n=1 Tax=Paraglomus occultum TaxID=144539 RepID=A0A9N8WH86_9GLOM|nr:7450_t:CDS:2 [Paraglomus occultum]